MKNSIAKITGVHVDSLSLVRRGCVAGFLTVLLALALDNASTATAASSDISSEIPISELNKVKKKTSSKQTKSESKKKKKSDVKANETAAKEVPVVSENNDQTQQKSSSEAVKPPEDIQIYHSPYSFVVPEKPTVIRAVIDSKTDIQSVNCSVRTSEGGDHSEVKMEKENGSQFTYIATLSGQSPKVDSLRYTIIVIDAMGKLTLSKEFSIPVTTSPVVPSWQVDGAGDSK
jgi:hypothetical protein